MKRIMTSPKMFIATSVLFALATLYNANSTLSSAPASRLTLIPNTQEVHESGPAVEHAASKPVRRS